jgi:hypothetical protein
MVQVANNAYCNGGGGRGLGGGLMEDGGTIRGAVKLSGHVPVLECLFFWQPLGRVPCNAVVTGYSQVYFNRIYTYRR